MSRQFMSCLLTLGLAGLLQAPSMAQGLFNGNAFGNTSPGGLGNAAGFATGGGMANSTTNSSNFGNGMRTRSWSAIVPGAWQGAGGLGYNTGNYQMNAGVGGGLPAVGNGVGIGGVMGPGGFVPGIAPPGFTKDMFGYDVAVGSDSGYTDFGSAMTASALGLGFGGAGYGPMGYGPMGYGPMVYGNPAIGNGMGFMTPADIAVANGLAPKAMNTPNGAQAPLPPRAATPQAGIDAGNNNASSNNNANANPSRPAVRRSFLNDNVPQATANAIRIQNRLHNVKSPNFKNIKVMMTGRKAILSGSVDSADDEKFAMRMVGLEPGVLEVKSDLVVNGTNAK